MKHRPLIAFAAGVTLLTACQGLKEALTAHVDVVARAQSQELSVTRVADLLGKAKLPIPVSRDNAGIIADLWVNYQLMGYAAAHNDSLVDKKAIDEALSGITKSMRLRRFMDTLSRSFKVDSGTEAEYAAGANDILAARHILIGFPGLKPGSPPPAPTPAQDDSVRKKAESIRPQVTSANFAQMAGRYSNEPDAGSRGGSLGVFEKSRMVPEFSNATAALKPGEISQPIRSAFGYHIIQRLSYADVKAQHGAQYAQMMAQFSAGKGESTYIAKLDADAKIDVKANAPTLVKEAAREPGKHHKDDATLASYKNGELTVGEFLGWLQSFPPNQRIQQQIQQAPDSAVRGFVKNIAERELLLAKADSAKIGLTQEEQVQMYQQFRQMVESIWQALGVDPKSLADSGKTAGERERIAAARIESAIDRVMQGTAQPVGVPAPLEDLIRDKFQWSINSAGLDRTTEVAQKVRAAEDSTRNANQPKSAVPMPGAQPPAAQPPAGQPQPTPGTKRP